MAYKFEILSEILYVYRSLLIPVSQKLVVQILLNTQFHTVLSTFGSA